MSELPARLRYTELEPEPLGIFERHEEPDEPSLLDRIVQPLTWGTIVVCLAVWALAGAVFWLPAMVRRVAFYSVALLQAMMEGDRPDEAGRRLRKAITFYARGFVTTVEVLTRTPKEEAAVAKDTETGERSLDFGRLALEAVWAAGVWYLVLVTVGVVDTSPLDLWNSFWPRFWLEVASSTWITGSNWVAGLF
jgi:hypothetical protein